MKFYVHLILKKFDLFDNKVKRINFYIILSENISNFIRIKLKYIYFEFK